jgi:hypothetical protein
MVAGPEVISPVDVETQSGNELPLDMPKKIKG